MKKAKRILAIAGLALIALMYTLTFVFAFMQDPRSKGLLMGAIFCTIAVPVIIYAMELVARNLRRKSEELQKEARMARAEEKTSSEKVSDSTHENDSGE